MILDNVYLSSKLPKWYIKYLNEDILYIITSFPLFPAVSIQDARTEVLLNSQLPGGVIQKGIDSLQDCLKKCANAGNGIADTPAALLSTNFGGQLCFGIDFDFSYDHLEYLSH